MNPLSALRARCRSSSIGRRWRYRSARLGPWLLGVTAAVYALLYVHGAFIRGRPVAVSPDEGSMAAFAMRLLGGHMLPYVDAVSQRGPLTYWLVALAQGLGGAQSFLPLRVLSAALAVATAVLVAVAPLRLGRPFAGAVAALTTAFCMTVAMGPHAGVGYNAELASLPFTVGGVLVVTREIASLKPKRSALLWVAAGVLIGLGALCKQLAIVFALPPLVVIAAGGAGTETWKGRARAAALFVAGVAAPILAVVVLYVVVGHWHDLWYWAVRYNASVYMAPITFEFRRTFLQQMFVEHAMLAWIAALLAITSLLWPWFALRAARRSALGPNRRSAAVLLAGLCGAVSIVAALAPARPWQNYFLYCVPWLALIFGLALDDLAPGPRVRLLARVKAEWVASGVLAAATIAGAWTAVRFERGPKGEHYAQRLGSAPICRYVARHSRPGDSLFVWGFRGDLYVSCHRKPASRFVVTPPVAGWIPWFPAMSVREEDAHAAPASRAQLIADLEKAKPAIIVDAPYASMAGRSMRRYRQLARFLASHYCQGPRIGQVRMFTLRRDGQACR